MEIHSLVICLAGLGSCFWKVLVAYKNRHSNKSLGLVRLVFFSHLSVFCVPQEYDATGYGD